MARRDRRHASGVLLGWLPVVLVLAILAGAGAAYRFDLGARWFGTGPDPASEPAAVEPPDDLSLPPLVEPARVAPGETDVAQLMPRAARRALAPFLADRDLGRHVLVSVAELADGPDGQPPVAVGAGTAVPASLTKLLTVTAALEALGPGHVFRTAVRRAGPGRIVLVGGGDPLLSAKPERDAWPARADVVSLARATARAMDGRRRVRLSYDDSLFTGPAVNPAWPNDYVPDGVVSPITSLWVDQGRAENGYSRVADPSATAAQAFADALERTGVRVLGRPRPGRAPRGSADLAAVESAPLRLIAERVIALSDNEGAEVLARHVGLATSGEGSSAAGVSAVVETLRGLGVQTSGARLRDGSGLSRRNQLDPDTLVDVLQLAADPGHPELRAVLTGLPVAGFTGSLTYRDGDAPRPARGLVRAKTGTLTGVTGLAGLATRPDGSALAFVLMADRVDLLDTLDARQAFDELAAALATCPCTR